MRLFVFPAITDSSKIFYTPAVPSEWPGLVIPAPVSTALDFIAAGSLRPPTWTSQGDLFAYNNRPVLRYNLLSL